jgi:hypothetical protein
MDERHGQIREGAGLDEARLNVEFIDFLKKWSTPILVVIAVIALGYFLLQKRRDSRVAARAAAYAQLDAAREAGSPAGLIAVADEHRGEGAVAEMAYLTLADIYLASSRLGISPEGRVDGAGTPDDPASLLTDEQKAQQLEKAAEFYKKVVDATSGNPDLAIHTIGGLYGLAAVAESKGDFEAARRHYDAIEVAAKNADMPEQVQIVKQRLETLGTLSNLPRLYVKADIPQSVAGSMPEGLVPVPNPFGPGQQPPALEDEIGPIGPAGPSSPSLTPETAPPPAPPPVEPETGAPGATPPGEKPVEEPAAEPKKEEPKPQEPKKDPK